MHKSRFVQLAAAAVLLAAGAATASSAEQSTDRIVVKLKPGATTAQAAQQERATIQRAGKRMSVLRHDARQGASVMQLDAPVPMTEARAIARRIAASPDVEYAAPDVRVKALTAPTDPYAHLQWHLSARGAANPGGAGFFSNHGQSQGQGVTVAVIDTGDVPHDDLSPNVIAGYDFVSDTTIAGDGGGRDADPSDPGDYCASTGSNSSWHGLKVASQIAAIANNGMGLAGGAPHSKVLQVRALGRCGGYLSDVADAIVWSAGGSVDGAPANPQPAKVINLSLGGEAVCFPYIQDAVNQARSRGAVVVAAAGNEGSTTISTPANCDGVIAVGAHTKSADLADYSNRAARLDLTAPGGGGCATQSANCANTPTLALSNLGQQGPAGPTSASYFAGTSAATPHVAAAAALMLAVKPDMTPDAVRSALKATAKPHAGDSFCAANQGQCGAGMLDVVAVLQSLAPVPQLELSVKSPASAVRGGAHVQFAVQVAGGNAPYTYRWEQVAGEKVAASGTTAALLSFSAPGSKTRDALGVSFRVTVTDASQSTLVETVSVFVDNPPKVEQLASPSVTAGKTMSLELRGSDPDGDAIEFEIVAAPDGVRIERLAGQPTLVWDNPTVGTHTIRYIAEAAGVESDEQTLTFTVGATSEGGGTGTGGGTSGGSAAGGGGSTSPVALGALALAAWAVRRRRSAR